MNNNIIKSFCKGLLLTTGVVAIASCADTWKDHYDNVGVSGSTYDGTTMQAIQEQAPEFASVIKAAGFDRELSSGNIYTVWAPADLDVNYWLSQDSATIVDKLIKNHIANRAYSVNGQEQKGIHLMSDKNVDITEDNLFGSAKIITKNITCHNGVMHIIEKPYAYVNNLFEEIQHQYDLSNAAGKDTLSLYSFLNAFNKDTIIESKSVYRGVDEYGNRICVSPYLERNNTALKNVNALIYREDSNYIAIIPSVEAYAKRYKAASELLKFNIKEEVSEGTRDSLNNYYANMFAMTDLYFNKTDNEHYLDSLKSTNYRPIDWEFNRYYRPFDANGILAQGKYNQKIECSNGDAYIVDEYPMSVTEQFFKKIDVPARERIVDVTTNDKNTPLYTKNASRTYIGGSIIDYDDDSVRIGSRNYNFMDLNPSSSSVNPQVGLQIHNTLSGTYDIFLVTCPIWGKTGFDNGQTVEDDPRPYRFTAQIFERDDDLKNPGEYPSKGQDLSVPDSASTPVEYLKYASVLGEKKNFVSNVENKIDTLYLGEYNFKNAYYSRNDEGVLLVISTSITSKQTTQYSREMLICGVILKPRFQEEVATEGKRRKL